MDIIVRKTYLSHIISHLNRGMMIILVGQRRVGKSFMLRQIHSWLEENRPGAVTVYINKEQRSFSHLANATDLYDYVSPHFAAGGDNYLLIDEVQDIEGYEDVLRSLHAEGRCRIIATGSIVKFMKSQGEKISEAVTSAYIGHLCKALIINPVTRYDNHGKKLFEMIFKYYFADHGLRNYICGFNLRSSIEKVMENVVYLHLLAQGYKVYVGILRAGKIDFVAVRGGSALYVQVAYLLATDETINREFGNLARIKDNYPKYVVSLDPVSGELDGYPGIHHIHLRDFLTTDL